MQGDRIEALRGEWRWDGRNLPQSNTLARSEDSRAHIRENDRPGHDDASLPDGDSGTDRAAEGDPRFRFHDDRGKPALLPSRGKRGSFEALVERYAGGPRSLAVMRELIRAKVARKLPGRRVEVLSRTFATMHWDESGVQMVGEIAFPFGNVAIASQPSP